MLIANDITKHFPGDAGPAIVLDRVSFRIDSGETVALTGESGSGKSTLLHIVAGLEPADQGEVTILDRPLSGLGDKARAAIRRETLGIVFQQFNLIPSLTVQGNIAFQARLAGQYDPAWTTRLTECLGLKDHESKYPEALSGGQQQRVAIGRALAGRPALVLADEPTGNLDEDTATAVMDLLVELAAETDAAVLMVTHSDKLASRMSRRLHLSHGRLKA